MAINLYIRLTTTESDLERNIQHYVETYRFQATGSDANQDIRNYRLRHFMTANTPNSTVTPNSGLSVYDGTGITPVTGSYNDWTTPNRPPKFDNGNSQFNTELIMRFDCERTFSQLANNSQAWITAPFASDNGVFSTIDVENAFSFLGYSNNNEYVKNPINVALEHKVAGGSVSKIYTDFNTLPASGISSCESNSNLYQVETVVVETATPHGLGVGDGVSLYSRHISHVPSYTGSEGRLFGGYDIVDGKWKGRGERYLGDFVVTSVPNAYTFTYQTYHNPMKINQSNHPVYTSSEWPDLVWEKWELYEYNESVNVSTRGTSSVFVFTDTDPSDLSCKHNFAVGDNVVFEYNGSTKAHLHVTAVAQDGTNIVAELNSGEIEIPSSVSAGTLVFTPRLPSSDVAFNVKNSDIAPSRVKSHSNESAIYYACQDTYYVKNGSASECHGNENEMELVRDTVIPIIKFPIPLYDGTATSDPNLVSRLFVFAKADGGLGENSLDLLGFDTDNWSETDTNSVIGSKHNGAWGSGSVIGTISRYSYTNPTRLFKNRYIKFDINNAYTVDILTGHASKTIAINSQKQGTTSDPIRLATREDDEAHWPYIVISSLTFIGKKPSISLENTYMYLVCDAIQRGTYGSGPAFVATVSNKLFDPSNIMYVRSWDDSKPFFAAGDTIEIMNTEHYNTVSAEVLGVSFEQNEVKVYFRYPDGDPDVEHGVSECGIIRNRSRMISTYEAPDAENVPENLHISGPQTRGSYGYAGNPVEFDIIHDEAIETSSLSAMYKDGNTESNTETPVILTDVEILATEGGHDRETDRFMHVGPDNVVVLKGFNLNTLSVNATAELGHIAWEDGIGTGTEAVLLPVDGHPDERKFYYDDAFNLQREMPVYGLRNVNNAVTEFKVKASDCPFIRGDVLAPILTGRYVDGTHTVPPIGLKYGANYYLADNPVPVENDSSYVWIRLSSSYISRFEEQVTDTPTYVLLDSLDVEYIDDICQTGTLMPLILYSTVTSVTIKDTDVDTKYYYNRLYLQIDEEAPICYVPEEEHVAGRSFDVYIADLNDIISINGTPLKDFSMGTITYLLPDKATNVKDARFIKVTLTLSRNTTLDIYDAAGNYTSLDLAVLNTDFHLDMTGISSSGTTHTLNFKVYDSDWHLLSNEKASGRGFAGVWADFGSIENISRITEESGGSGYFTFDLVLTDDVIAQSNGHLEVWAGDNNMGEGHKISFWNEPIVFKKNFTCVKTGDELKYNGVNLFETSTYELILRGPTPNAFSIVRPIERMNEISIKVVANQPGTKSFGVQWKNHFVPTSVANYVNSVTLTADPTIDIQPEANKNVKWKKGTPWTEPDPSDVIANGTNLSEIQITVDNDNWDDAGIHTITYTVEDSCQRKASVERKVTVTECNIPIILTKCPNPDENAECVYDLYEDIEIQIHPESPVLFNQYVMNNIVYYQLNGSTEWITANIISGTSDRRSLTIKNPGVLASGMTLKVDVGEDNNTANGCYATNPVNFSVMSKEEQDKPLDVDGKSSIVKKNSRTSRFDELNFEPIYNKDLSYSSFTITADENSLMQNVYSILLTNLGERLYDDEFGSTLEESVFEIIGDLNGESKLLNQCVNLINKYEPRVVVVEDKSFVAINDDNTVAIILYIKVPRGIARKIELTFRKST